jgi:intein/homing endonuclease
MTHPHPVALSLPTTEVELAYLAGIIDGEGSISRLNRDRPRRWTVSIASTSPELIEWLLQFGGHVHDLTNPLARKPGWQWVARTWRDVHALLSAVEPYLIIKREIANRAIREIEAWLQEVAS